MKYETECASCRLDFPMRDAISVFLQTAAGPVTAHDLVICPQCATGLAGPAPVVRMNAAVSLSSLRSAMTLRWVLGVMGWAVDRWQKRHRMYVRYSENNRDKGEYWTFWLPERGNEKELERLREVIAATEAEYDEFPYSMGPDRLCERDVDLLTDFAEAGYWGSHEKVAGRLVLPEDFEMRAHSATVFDNPLDELLERGQIYDLFRTGEREEKA